ncbi:hypothetical protein K438DRAFT_1971138 [Mycena galopus ATCC 62051]|nr:hypothetical protein K438DRAFT_1971138 [Mycena galopus ATCC 62051]
MHTIMHGSELLVAPSQCLPLCVPSAILGILEPPDPHTAELRRERRMSPRLTMISCLLDTLSLYDVSHPLLHDIRLRDIRLHSAALLTPKRETSRMYRHDHNYAHRRRGVPGPDSSVSCPLASHTKPGAPVSRIPRSLVTVIMWLGKIPPQRTGKEVQCVPMIIYLLVTQRRLLRPWTTSSSSSAALLRARRSLLSGDTPILRIRRDRRGDEDSTFSHTGTSGMYRHEHDPFVIRRMWAPPTLAASPERPDARTSPLPRRLDSTIFCPRIDTLQQAHRTPPRPPPCVPAASALDSVIIAVVVASGQIYDACVPHLAVPLPSTRFAILHVAPSYFLYLYPLLSAPRPEARQRAVCLRAGSTSPVLQRAARSRSDGGRASAETIRARATGEWRRRSRIFVYAVGVFQQLRLLLFRSAPAIANQLFRGLFRGAVAGSTV